MRRLLALVVVCAFAVSCDGDEPVPPTSPSPAPTPSPPSPNPTTSSPDPTPGVPTPSVSPTPEGAVLVQPDVDPAALDVPGLAPARHDVTGAWFGTAAGADVAVVAVAGPGDAFSRDRAVWTWTRRPDLGGWLGRRTVAYPARRGVLDVDVTVADVTDDGDDDAVIFAFTGGSGGCGIWSVLDLTTDERLFARDLCDATVDPSRDPVGLLLTRSVYRPGDPHCCPSARRETVLTYAGGTTWTVERRETTRVA